MIALTPNRILHGDCVQLMTALPAESVDFILTDPPYLVRYRDRTGRRVANDDNAKVDERSDGLGNPKTRRARPNKPLSSQSLLSHIGADLLQGRLQLGEVDAARVDDLERDARRRIGVHIDRPHLQLRVEGVSVEHKQHLRGLRMKHGATGRRKHVYRVLDFRPRLRRFDSIYEEAYFGAHAELPATVFSDLTGPGVRLSTYAKCLKSAARSRRTRDIPFPVPREEEPKPEMSRRQRSSCYRPAPG